MKNNKVTSALLAVIIAFGLWFYVTTVVQPESDNTYYNIPVVLQNEELLAERKLMLISDAKPTATVHLAGSRTNLNNIDPSDLTLIADLSNIREAGEYELSYTVNPPGSVPSNSVTTLSKSPEKIKVTVARKAEKYVDVVVNWQGSVPEGYMLDRLNAVLDPNQVYVTGPEEVVNQIARAVITVNCDGQTESMAQSYAYTLVDENGEPLDVQMIETNALEIHLQVRIARTKVLPLKLNVTDGGGATEENSDILIDPGVITVTGSEAALEDLEELVIGSVNLGEITDKTVLEFPINLPEGVTNESGVSMATVTIDFPKLEKKTFDITDIKALNVPAGMEATIGTRVLSITVRGPAAQIRAMKLSDIIVQVDLAELVGTETVEPIITFGAAYPDVGAVGKYSVVATVTTATEPTEPEE